MKINLKLLLLFLLILIVSATLVGLNETKDPEVNKTETAIEENTLSPQTNSDGEIEVKAEPKVSNDKKMWNFRITLTAHSGSLDEDLTKASLVIDDQGNKLNPLRWEGSPPGGHHREGTLFFPSFSKSPKFVTLVIQNIGGVERTFSWKTN
ncbi:MAG: hypothetical protein AAB801_02510 [Patescibacteria group bacterium]